MEFSKKILYWLVAITLLVIIYSLGLQYFIIVNNFQGSTSLIDNIILGIFGLLSIAVGSYYFKAKLENSIKLKLQYGKQLVEESEEEIKNEGNDY